MIVAGDFRFRDDGDIELLVKLVYEFSLMVEYEELLAAELLKPESLAVELFSKLEMVPLKDESFVVVLKETKLLVKEESFLIKTLEDFPGGEGILIGVEVLFGVDDVGGEPESSKLKGSNFGTSG